LRGDSDLDAPTLLKGRLQKVTNPAAQSSSEFPPNRLDARRIESDENCTRFFMTGNSTF
jgi:hypothetical protein